MAIQLSTAVRNARLDAIETAIGTDAVIKLFTGAMPADCATANSGTEVASITCPTDYMAAASSGSKSKSGTWSATASDTGTAGYFRQYESTATTCHLQGTVTATSGGGDMEVDNTSFASGQTFTITTFTLTDGNA